ncbi:hypothetical protein HPULCUR_002179 [Helicostylum pulchrum]|uniref:Uncharacterized protein n=1 Tax=Helicostylum pulchrum TaxID=562976 RepID=A0ABP9XQW8_9FUNG
MYLGDDHEHEETINAFVFESKFDIILGRTWLKTRAPKPNWSDDTWEIQNLNKDIPINISQQLFTTHPTYTRNTDTKMNDSVDYLLSANQVSRLLKKDEVEECYMLYFMNDKTGNSVLSKTSILNEAK